MLILFACWIKGQACALEGCPMVVGFERASDKKIAYLLSRCKIRVVEVKLFGWSLSRFVEC